MIEACLRTADARDRDAIFSLLRGAALWLRDREIDYWQNWLEPPEHHVRWIDDGLAAGEFRMVESSCTVIGCVRLQASDPLFWGSRDDSAAYVHSLTVDRSLAGRGVGARILNSIARELAAEGVEWLRLDCGEGNAGLRRYYESCGFSAVGETVVDGERLTLYERPLSDRQKDPST